METNHVQRSLQMLYYVEKHISKLQMFHRFVERVVIAVENEVYDYQDEGNLFPSEDMIQLLNSMCRYIYVISIVFERKNSEILTYFNFIDKYPKILQVFGSTCPFT